MTNLNSVQDELLSQIQPKSDELNLQIQKYKDLVNKIKRVSFKPQRIRVAEVPEVTDDDGNITQEYIPPSNEVVYNIKPQTDFAPVRDLTDDEINNSLVDIENTLNDLNS